jgi:DNA-directed RNA polymerase specialized sigma24 family protein
VTPEEKKAKREIAFRDADWEALSKATTKYAKNYLRGRFKAYARDISQTAMEKVWSGDHDWDMERVPDLAAHLRTVVNTLAWNKMTSAAESRQARDGEGAIAHAHDSAPSPETVANNRELLDMCAEELVERFGQKGVDYLRSLEDLPEEQAAQVGLTVDQMYRLRYKTAEYCKDVLKQPYIDSKGLAVEGAHGADPAPALSAEIAAVLEQNAYAESRRRVRIYVARGLLVASLVALAAIAMYFTR